MKKIFGMFATAAVVLSVGVSSVFGAGMGGNMGGQPGGNMGRPGEQQQQQQEQQQKVIDNTDVNFYVQVNGAELDSEGNVESRDTGLFSGIVASGELKEKQADGFSLTAANVPNDGSTEDDAEIRALINGVPTDAEVLEAVKAEFVAKGAVLKDNTSSVVNWEKFNEADYRVHWYVLKYDASDCWHVDGIVVDRKTDEAVIIVTPSEEEGDPATCVKYDVKAGTYTPGIMEIEGLRPHNDANGDNDNLIVEGFEDVWYTVLKKGSFEANTNVIPSELIEAANEVAELAGARLGELDEKLQWEYGRIDSQAWKPEYINRSGDSSLFITPFINSQLEVDKDEYIWLAQGDRNGNILYVYVMDREMAGIDENLFDGE